MLDPNTIALLGQLGISPEQAAAAMGNLLMLTLLTVAAAIPTAILAKRKGRSVALWLVFALSIPLLPLLLVWLLPPVKRQPEP
jgi:cytochrome bd-type quinol oxidase subunit 1